MRELTTRIMHWMMTVNLGKTMQEGGPRSFACKILLLGTSLPEHCFAREPSDAPMHAYMPCST